MPHILLGCAKLAALLRYPAGMWEAVHSFSLLFPILAETEARACDMINKKKMSAGVQCSLTAGEPPFSMHPVRLPSVMHLNEAQ